MDCVLFESYAGKVIGDSPKDIFLALQKTRPNLKFYWTISANQKAPQGSIGLVHGSRQWLKVLASAKYLVNNSNFPWYFRKAEGQVYLQTWHGTPLKRLGRDIHSNKLTKGYLETMDREATYWNYLISPSSYCTKTFPAAFNYAGQIIETGYPRNDRLVIPPTGLREEVRKKLSLTGDVKLVLYAPTWRDSNRSQSGHWEGVNFLKPELKLPPGFQLAFRGHSNTHPLHNVNTAGGAIDLTLYPDITELFLAADVLITDYSSAMFDFTVTGKPVLFLAPDLSMYEEERGFYFNYRQTAPGPILSTSEEVVEALGKLDLIIKQYEAPYASWQKLYNSLEDGNATQRVIDVVFKH